YDYLGAEPFGERPHRYLYSNLKVVVRAHLYIELLYTATTGAYLFVCSFVKEGLRYWDRPSDGSASKIGQIIREKALEDRVHAVVLTSPHGSEILSPCCRRSARCVW